MAKKSAMGLRFYFAQRESLREHVARCDQDSDAVSIQYLPGAPAEDGSPERCEGALVVIKGGKAVALFRQWAIRNGLLTAGKPIDEAEPFVADDKGRVHFLADVDGELLSECFFVDVVDGVTHLALVESGDLHDGLGPLADYLDHFADGVYTSGEAFKSGDRRAFDEVLAVACAAVGVTREKVEADDAAAEKEHGR